MYYATLFVLRLAIHLEGKSTKMYLGLHQATNQPCQWVKISDFTEGAKTVATDTTGHEKCTSLQYWHIWLMAPNSSHWWSSSTNLCPRKRSPPWCCCPFCPKGEMDKVVFLWLHKMGLWSVSEIDLHLVNACSCEMSIYCTLPVEIYEINISEWVLLELFPWSHNQ